MISLEIFILLFLLPRPLPPFQNLKFMVWPFSLVGVFCFFGGFFVYFLAGCIDWNFSFNFI